MWTCPRMPFLDWVRKTANQYTFHYSQVYNRGNSTYYGEVLAGRVSVDDSSFERARSMLSSDDVLVLTTEDLSNTGWDELDIFLGRPGFKTSTYERVTNINSATNTNSYRPSEELLKMAAELNKYDLLLYKEFARHPNAVH